MIRRLILAGLIALFPALASAQFAIIGPTQSTLDSGDRLATTAWVNNFFGAGLPLASGKIWIGSAGNLAVAQTPSGDCTVSLGGVITCTNAAGNFNVVGTLTVGGVIIDSSGELQTNIAAPSTPAAGKTRVYVDITQKVLTFKNDAGTVGNAVVPSTCGANLFGTSISAAGVFGCTQPAVANLSGFGTGVATALGTALNAAGGLLGASNSANPSATASDAAVNGTALTFMRSDAAPAVQKATNAAFGVAKCDNLGLICTTGTIALKNTGATIQAIPGNPTGTTSAAGVMMGLGSTCTITPTYSSRIKFEIIPNLSNSTISQTMFFKVYWGTGAAPVNGAATTGTQVGASNNPDSGTANFHYPAVSGGIVTGLTPGTAYWFDANIGTTGGTVTIINISCNAFEF